MCRICSYYTKIDLKQLPTSNPFLDGASTPTPIEAEVELELELPNTIIIESPESNRQTAWTNLNRFPSLHRARVHPNSSLLSPPIATSPQAAPRSISIYGPREVSKFSQQLYHTFGSQDRQSNTNLGNSANRNTSFHRKLQHHIRVNSFPEIMTDGSVSGMSSLSSTPRNLSPVSDDEEFAYLPSPVELIQAFQPRTVSTRTPAKYKPLRDVTAPEPLNLKRYKDQPTTRWT